MNNNILKKYTFWNNINNQLTQNFDFSQTAISELADKSKQDDYLNKDYKSSLHEYIFKFYAYNELLASYRTKNNGIIDNEDLSLYKDYQDFTNDFSKRIFSFILYSCLTECSYSEYITVSFAGKSRHFNNKLMDSYIESQIENLAPDIKLIDIDPQKGIDYGNVINNFVGDCYTGVFN